MNIKVLATILLIGHTVSAGFIFFVLKRQLALFRLKIDPELVTFRRVLFFLSVAIFLGNFVPIGIDLLTIFSNLPRAKASPAGIYYAFSNMLVMMLSAGLIWTMYRLAAKTATLVESDKIKALNKKTKKGTQ